MKLSIFVSINFLNQFNPILVGLFLLRLGKGGGVRIPEIMDIQGCAPHVSGPAF